MRVQYVSDLYRHGMKRRGWPINMDGEKPAMAISSLDTFVRNQLSKFDDDFVVNIPIPYLSARLFSRVSWFISNNPNLFRHRLVNFAEAAEFLACVLAKHLKDNYDLNVQIGLNGKMYDQGEAK